LGSMGAAQAGAALAQGQAYSNIAQSVPNALITSRFFQQPAAAQAPIVLGGGF
jgi:hypothetical protein